MIKIPIHASKNYTVTIENDAFKSLGAVLKSIGAKGKVLIISDDNVAPLYLDAAKNMVEKEGCSAFDYVIKSGEESKSLQSFGKITEYMAQNHFDRRDTVVALGGGVVGDLSGFCSASYMRGIDFVQVPTSLLAMVDSSVGGKTAVNLPEGKNLVGAFYQPSAVIADPQLLKTLPEKNIKDGFGEIIKYAMIKESGLCDLLAGGNNMQEIIARCIRIKADIVAEDEKESGVRKILNFGHTVAHAIEIDSRFEISHGQAVAMGMYIITRAFVKMGRCEANALETLEKMLDFYGIDKTYRGSAPALARICASDKKAEHGKINLIAITRIGNCVVEKVDLSRLEEIIKEGME